MDFIDKIYKEIGASDLNQDVSDWLSVGYLPLNKAISGKYSGGLPVGRITEIFGAESSGKTLQATIAMIETQRRGGLAVFLDFEHAFSIRRARTLGLDDDPKKWIYKQPETAEQGFSIIELIANMVRESDSEKYITVVVDSVAAMMTQEELDTGYGEGNMRTKLSLPAVMSTSLKKLGKLVSKTNITLIFLNQTRSNPGVMFGDKEKTTGGNALKFYASTRIKLVKKGKVKDGEEVIGENVEAQVIKNKVFEPFGVANYIGHFKEGISLAMSHMVALFEMGKLGSSKGWYEWEGKKYRAKELEALLKSDSAEYEAFLEMFDDAE